MWSRRAIEKPEDQRQLEVGEETLPFSILLSRPVDSRIKPEDRTRISPWLRALANAIDDPFLQGHFERPSGAAPSRPEAQMMGGIPGDRTVLPPALGFK